MNNVAFLFSGQLRGFSQCIEDLNKFLFSKFKKINCFFYIPVEDHVYINDILKLNPTTVCFENDFYHNLENFTGSQNNIGYSDYKINHNNFILGLVFKIIIDCKILFGRDKMRLLVKRTRTIVLCQIAS
jgi:hypothetical protein